MNENNEDIITDFLEDLPKDQTEFVYNPDAKPQRIIRLYKVSYDANIGKDEKHPIDQGKPM